MYSMSSVCVYFEFMYIRSVVNSYDSVCSCCTDKSVFHISISLAVIFPVMVYFMIQSSVHSGGMVMIVSALVTEYRPGICRKGLFFLRSTCEKLIYFSSVS